MWFSRASAGDPGRRFSLESVQWISGLDDVLVGTFLLVTFLLFERGKYIGSLGVFTLALLTKETAVVFPALVFARVLFQDDRPPGKKLKTAFFAASPFLLLAIAFVLVRAKAVGLGQSPDFWGGSPLFTALIMLKAFSVYVRLILFPVALRIGYYFEMEHFLSWTTLAGGACLLAAAVAIATSAGKRPLFAFGGLWFFIFMLPASNIVPIRAIVGERFLYLPLMGIALVLAGILPLGKNKGKWAGSLFLALLFLLGLGASHRVGVWTNETVFWEDIIRKEPEMFEFKTNLANRLALDKRYERAEELFKQVLEKDPWNVPAASGLAQVFFDTGRLEKSLTLYGQLSAVRPNDPSYRRAKDRILSRMKAEEAWP